MNILPLLLVPTNPPAGKDGSGGVDSNKKRPWRLRRVALWAFLGLVVPLVAPWVLLAPLAIVMRFVAGWVGSGAAGQVAHFNGALDRLAMPAAAIRIVLLAFIWYAWPAIVSWYGKVRKWSADYTEKVILNGRRVPLACLIFEVVVIDLPIWTALIGHL